MHCKRDGQAAIARLLRKYVGSALLAFDELEALPAATPALYDASTVHYEHDDFEEEDSAEVAARRQVVARQRGRRLRPPMATRGPQASAPRADGSSETVADGVGALHALRHGQPLLDM